MDEDDAREAVTDDVLGLGLGGYPSAWSLGTGFFVRSDLLFSPEAVLDWRELEKDAAIDSVRDRVAGPTAGGANGLDLELPLDTPLPTCEGLDREV